MNLTAAEYNATQTELTAALAALALNGCMSYTTHTDSSPFAAVFRTTITPTGSLGNYTYVVFGLYDVANDAYSIRYYRTHLPTPFPLPYPDPTTAPTFVYDISTPAFVYDNPQYYTNFLVFNALV
jgi:hypothetical protein